MTAAPVPVEHRERVTALASAIASAVAVVLANLSGLAISDDGIAYLAIADRLSQGRGLGYHLEAHLTTWPPLFPTLLSWIDRLTPLDTHGAAITLNALTAAATVLLTAALLSRLVADSMLRRLGTVVAALGASTMLFGHLLTSDFILGAVVLGALLVLVDHYHSPSWVGPVVAGVLTGVGFGFRYAAVAFIPAFAIWPLLDTRRAVATRIRGASLYVVVAASFPALWMWRNHSVDGTLLGPRWSSARGLPGNVFDAVSSVGNLLLPGVEFERRSMWAAVAVVCLVVMMLLTWRALGGVPTAQRAMAILAGPVGLLFLHVGAHLAYLVYARTTTAFDRLSFRLLEPVAGPAMLLGLVVIDRVVAGPDPRWARFARAIAVGWASLSLVVGVAMVPYFATGPDLFEGNYERDAYVRLRASRVLDEIPPECRVLSNLPNALYEAGVEAGWTPRRSEQQSDEMLSDLSRFPEQIAREQTCVVWVDLPPHLANLYPLDELERMADFDEIAHTPGITLYRVEPR